MRTCSYVVPDSDRTTRQDNKTRQQDRTTRQDNKTGQQDRTTRQDNKTGQQDDIDSIPVVETGLYPHNG
jgi:hypothetical protein